MEVKRGTKKLIKVEAGDGLSKPSLVALSNSDLIMHAIHVEIIYAFQAPVPSSQALQEGLAKALGEYQELAGRLSADDRGRPAIALNGHGCAWIEAEANVDLLDLMPFSPGDELSQLSPPTQGAEELFLVQMTKFRCGSITLGTARSHLVVDGSSGSTFLGAWASAVKGLPFSSIPTHDRSALRARDPPEPTFEHIEYTKSPPKPLSAEPQDPPLSKRKIHFSVEMLQKIKAEAVKDLTGDGFYSTFHSLTGHLWRCITKARGLAGDVETKLSVAVNGRGQLSLPEDHFGNVIFHACAKSTARALTDRPLSYAADLLQRAIRRVDRQYMLSALDFCELALQLKDPLSFAKEYRNILPSDLVVTTWAKLPLYQLDFGCGTPVFAGPARTFVDGYVVFAQSHTKDGSIDVVLSLRAPAMERLEALAYEI